MNITIPARINIALATGVVLVLLVAWGSDRTINALIGDAQRVSHAQQTFILLEKLGHKLKAAESQQRKYLLSPDANDLKDYRQAQVGVSLALARVRSEVALDSGEAQLPALESLISRRLDLMELAVNTLQSDGVAAAVAIVENDLNRQLADDTDRLVEELVNSGMRALQQSQNTGQRSAQAVELLIIAGALLSLVLMMGAIFFIHHYQSGRRRAEALLRESESQLRQITDAVPALIAYVDVERRVHFHNKAYEEICGLNAREINGKTMREVMGHDLYESVRSKVDEVLAGTPVSYQRTHKTTAGGVREYMMSYFPKYGESGKDSQCNQVIGFFALGTDITEMKRIDRMKTEFVSTVSHELRTPLTSIRGSLGLIAGGVAGTLPDALKNLVDIAKNNCERLIRLINDILDSEKIESGQMRLALQVVALQPLLQQVLAANEGFASQHGVSLRLQAPDEAVFANIDTDRINQVLTNLVSNAVKFSPRSGVVEVALSTVDRQVRVEIRDCGPGIPAEFRQRIFRKFSQADSSDARLKGGTGLGLNISKAIVELLGGTIGFDTAEGVGSTFFFQLPKWTEPSSPSIVSPVAALSGLRILVCEDDPDIARLIGMMLEKAGFEADLVYSGKEALAHLAGQTYAAMTVDLKLPDQDGIALIQELRREDRTRNLPIVVISATAGENQVRIDNQPLSVSNWLGKPIDENLLIRGLKSVIAGSAERPRILHVEDDLDIQRIVGAIAKDFATFEFATTLQEAREQLRAQRFDLILLDLSLPSGSGWDLLSDIEALKPRPPVVVFSASDVKAGEDRRAAAILVKAQTSNAELLETIQRVLKFDIAIDSKDT